MKEEEYPKPPKWVNKFVEWYCLKTYQDEVLGDLQELFERKVENEGKRAAQFWYYRNALLFMRLYNLKLIQNGIQFLTPGDMWKNYVKLSYRHMRKNAPYLTINILGLGLALATGIFAYVLFEYNAEFNHYYKNTENIYSVGLIRQAQKGDYEIMADRTPVDLGTKALEEIPGINNFARYFRNGEVFSNGVEVFNEEVTYVDPSFLDFFSYEFIEGNKNTLYNDPLAVYLTKDIARKYFGEEKALGKTVYINYQTKNEDDGKDQIIVEQLALKVAGVFAKIPKNNSFQIQILVGSHHYFNLKKIDEDNPNTWAKAVTFIRLEDRVNKQSIEDGLNGFSKTYSAGGKGTWQINDFFLTPFMEIAGMRNNLSDRGLRQYYMDNEPVIIFVVIAILIILVACFNFTNTGMALAQKRVREIGVRKALGGVKSQIIFQFLLENILSSAIALLLSVYFADLFMQYIARTGPPFELVFSGNYSLFVFLGVILLVVSFIAGIYPALYVGGMDPSPILKGSLQLKGASTYTKVLLGIQFAISFIAVFGGIVMYRNVQYQQTIDVGYDYDHLVYAVPIESQIDAFAHEVAQLHQVEKVAISPGIIRNWVRTKEIKYDDRTLDADWFIATPDYLEVAGVNIKIGKIPQISSKDTIYDKIVINSTMVEKLDLSNPLGSIIEVDSAKKFVVGVFQKIVNNGYRDKDDELDHPMIIQLTGKQAGYVVVKTQPDKLLEVEDEMMSIWRKYHPYMAYNGDLLKNELGDSMTMSRVFGEIFFFLAILTILLSASGLFALMSLTINRKVKEIGIRKVLGASFEQIVLVINKPYLLIVFIAWLIGTTAGYFFSFEVFLSRFRYHISPDALPFIISLGIILIIAAITMGGKVLSAASASPSNTLRSD